MDATLIMKPNNTLLMRVVSAVIGIPCVIGIVLAGFNWLFPLAMLILLGLYREVTRMTVGQVFSVFSFTQILIPMALFTAPQYLLESVVFVGCITVSGLWLYRENLKNFLWMAGAATYVTSAIVSLCLLSAQGKGILVLWSLIVVWLADTGAYLFGSKLGGPKLAPKISPSKTWSGFVGGSCIAILGAYIFNTFYNVDVFFLLPFIVTAILVTMTSHTGDLVESMFKRRFDVKDAGSIIPGHGGLFDRLDSILLVMLILPFLLR